MTTTWRPTALILPDLADVHPRSVTKALMFAELNWPRQILEEPVVRIEAGGRPIYFVAEPRCARAVLSAGDELFPKASVYERILGTGTGNLCMSAISGGRSKAQRQIFAPLFGKKQVAALVPLFLATAEATMTAWAGDGMRFDISHAAHATTFRVVTRMMFGECGPSIPLPAQAEEIIDPLHEALIVGDMRRQAELCDQAARALLCRRPRNPLLPGNPFAATADLLGDQEVIDNTRMFLAAGSETTALTLTWCMWILGRLPHVQARVQEEIDAVLGDRPITADNLARLPFLAQVLRETLRLYPPGALSPRQTLRDTEIAGWRFETGSVVGVNFYALHRHRNWWSDPDAFLPERFAADDDKRRDDSAFLPFGVGPHACVGGEVGWLEALSVLAVFLRRYRFESEQCVLPPRMRITLRPQEPVWVRVWTR